MQAQPSTRSLPDELQVLIGEMGAAPSDVVVADLRRLAARIPTPASFVEEAVLERVLRAFAMKTARHYCLDDPDLCSERESVLSAFRHWIEELSAETLGPVPCESTMPEPFRRALWIMYAECGRPLKKNEMARRVGVSSSTFSTQFNRASGRTFREVLGRIRMAKAAQLIRHGTKPDFVHGDVGYRSRAEFYRSFKRLAGCTPAEYRQRAAREAGRVAG